MIKPLVTVSRVRSIIAGARTEKDAADALRRHKVRYSFSTEGGCFHIRIPGRTGIIAVIRTASRSDPLRVGLAAPASVSRFPFLLPVPGPVPGPSFTVPASLPAGGPFPGRFACYAIQKERK